jgi:peptidoglycan hydrolase CwlO-like protein
MNKRTSALIIFASLIFFTAAGYAVDKNIEALQVQLTEAHSKLKVLEEENRDLKKRLASKENEVSGYRLALENIEGEIKALKDVE